MAPLELSRREFVGAAGALAAASAFGGCSPGTRRELGAALAQVQGGIVGPSDTRGHLIRDGAWLGRAPQGRESTGIAILGGGIAGLSAAWALERAGYHDFVVLELEDTAGGTSRYGETPTTPHPWGAHYLPVPPPDARAARAFLEEIGVIEYYDAAGRPRCAEQHLCRAPQERVFYKGRWYEGLYLHAGASAEDRRQLQRFHDEVARWVRARANALHVLCALGSFALGSAGLFSRSVCAARRAGVARAFVWALPQVARDGFEFGAGVQAPVVAVAPVVGIRRPVFSARYIRQAPDSNTAKSPASRSTMAGIRPLGQMAKYSGVFCSPLLRSSTFRV